MMQLPFLLKQAAHTRVISIVVAAWSLSLCSVSLFGADFASQLKMAEAGDAEAQFFVGRSYHHGAGVSRDDAKARVMYEKAAAQGNAKAMNNLAAMCLEGRGEPKDEKAAMAWLRRAAEHGADLAQLTLAVRLQEGRSVKRDVPEAVEWFQRAAQQGNVDAKRRLALIYYDGAEGVEKDYTKAVSVVKPLAESGDPWAMNTFAAMHEFGQGVPKDDRAALEWLRKAADAGDVRALFNLGSRYASGHGVKRDIVQACVLLEVSLKKGEGAAQALLFELTPALTPAQAEEVKRQVSKSPTLLEASP